MELFTLNPVGHTAVISVFHSSQSCALADAAPRDRPTSSCPFSYLLIFSYLMGQVFAACLLVQVLIGHFLWSVDVAEPSWAAVHVDIGSDVITAY